MAEAALQAAEKLRALCRKQPELKVLEQENCGGFAFDRTKVTVNVSGWGYTGVEAGDMLRQAGIAQETIEDYAA